MYRWTLARWWLHVSALLLLTCPSSAWAAKARPAGKPNLKKILSGPVPGYSYRRLEGFHVLVHQAVLDHNADAVYRRKPLDVLEGELCTVVRSLPTRAVEILQTVPIWVEWHDESDPTLGRVVAKYYSAPGGVVLWNLGKNKNPLKANCVEVIDMMKLTAEHQPGIKLERCVMLHELAHAVHGHIFGDRNAIIEATYKQAMARHLYDKARDVYGVERPPYARVNAHEYFAELSCAYLNKLHYFPFDRADLKTHDPQGYKLMTKVWGTTKQLTAGGRANAEKFAARKLASARRLQGKGKGDEARRTLESLAANYPDTKAAQTARKMLPPGKLADKPASLVVSLHNTTGQPLTFKIGTTTTPEIKPGAGVTIRGSAGAGELIVQIVPKSPTKPVSFTLKTSGKYAVILDDKVLKLREEK